MKVFFLYLFYPPFWPKTSTKAWHSCMTANPFNYFPSTTPSCPLLLFLFLSFFLSFFALSAYALHFFVSTSFLFGAMKTKDSFLKWEDPSKQEGHPSYPFLTCRWQPRCDLDLALHAFFCLLLLIGSSKCPSSPFLHLPFSSPIARWSMSTNPCCSDSGNLFISHAEGKKICHIFFLLTLHFYILITKKILCLCLFVQWYHLSFKKEELWHF